MAELGRPSTTASIRASVSDSGEAVVALSGDLDLSGVRRVAADLDAFAEEHRDGIVFDLEEVDFMDSSGIALLLRAATKVQGVEVRHPSSVIRRIIEVTGLSDMLRVGPG